MKFTDATAKDVIQQFEKLGFLGSSWIDSKVVIAKCTPSEAASEAYELIVSRCPNLSEWPAKKTQRSGRPPDILRATRFRLYTEAVRLNKDVLVHFDEQKAPHPPTWGAWPGSWRQAVKDRRFKLKIQKELCRLKAVSR